MLRPSGVTTFTARMGAPRRRNSSPIPKRSASLSAVGDNPEPQVLSRGVLSRSNNNTDTPRRASSMAADAPAGPAPTTITSAMTLGAIL